MPPSAWLGIDIAKDSFAACLLTDKTTATGSFANTPAGLAKLERWLTKRKITRVHACLEATGRYGEAPAEHLHAAGHTVSVINPARRKAFGQATLTRTKTDQTDAALLADFCRRQQPAAWTPPDPAREPAAPAPAGSQPAGQRRDVRAGAGLAESHPGGPR